MATLEELRKQLDTIDDQIVHLYEERMRVCEENIKYSPGKKYTIRRGKKRSLRM